MYSFEPIHKGEGVGGRDWIVRIRSLSLSSALISITHTPLDDTPPPSQKIHSSVLELPRSDSNQFHSSIPKDPLTTGPIRNRRGSFVWGAEKGDVETMQISERVPEDLLTPIFEQLQDQRDLYACSLVSRTFNRAVTPILYRSWDTRVIVDLPANDRFKRSHKVFPELLLAVFQGGLTFRLCRSSTQFKLFWRHQNFYSTSGTLKLQVRHSPLVTLAALLMVSTQVRSTNMAQSFSTTSLRHSASADTLNHSPGPSTRTA